MIISKEKFISYIEKILNASTDISSLKKNYIIDLDYEKEELYIIFNLPISDVVISEDLYFKLYNTLCVPVFPFITLKPVFYMDVREVQSLDLGKSRAFCYSFKKGVSRRLSFASLEEYTSKVLEQKKFVLMEDYFIDFKEISSFSTTLVSGSTGSGKTAFLKLFINSFNLIHEKSEIFLIDIKKDLAKISCKDSSSITAVVPSHDNIENFFSEVIETLEKIRSIIDDRNNKNFNDIVDISSRSQVLVVIDELQVLNALLSSYKKYKENFNVLLLSISLLGRSAGVSLVLAGQEMSSKTVDTAIRNNASLNVLLGRLNKNTLQYLFPDISNLFVPEDFASFGRGIVEYKGDVSYLFVPFIKNWE